MRDLYVVRHGQAAGGESGMDRDFFLTDEGKRQAHALGKKLKEIGVSPVRIYSSRLNRARETAEIVSRYVPAPVELRDDLIEHGSGVLLLDCSKLEAARLNPDKLRPDGSLIISQGLEEQLNWDFSVGGETLRALHARARGAFDAIMAAHPEPDCTCIVTAHGSFLSAMLTEVLGLPMRGVWNFGFANAAFLHLRFHADASSREARPVICVHHPDGDFPDKPDRSEKLDTDMDNK